jgi:hypothetical protein
MSLVPTEQSVIVATNRPSSCSQARERSQFAMDFYVLSDSHTTNYSLAGLQDGKDAYSGMVSI